LVKDLGDIVEALTCLAGRDLLLPLFVIPRRCGIEGALHAIDHALIEQAGDVKEALVLERQFLISVHRDIPFVHISGCGEMPAKRAGDMTNGGCCAGVLDSLLAVPPTLGTLARRPVSGGKQRSRSASAGNSIALAARTPPR